MAKSTWTNPLKPTEEKAQPLDGWGRPIPEPEPEPEPQDNSDLDEGRIETNGVGLRKGELTALKAMQDKYGLARNALIRLAVRRLILAERAGTADIQAVDPEVKIPKRKIIYPE